MQAVIDEKIIDKKKERRHSGYAIRQKVSFVEPKPITLISCLNGNDRQCCTSLPINKAAIV